ncbi:PleD family two-component system response regulator, partial [candidate division CSSED10-310 bacterium]
MAKATILIAEDDRSIADLLKTSLEPFGYEILLTTNGEDTCMSFVNNSPDLILLDILMPKMNGFQVCEWIRHRSYRNDTPIIMMSGVYRKKEQQEDAIRKGATDFLIKPFRINYLLEKIEFHLNTKKRTSAEAGEEILLESEVEQFSYVGKLAESPIEALLHLLFTKRETGKLILKKNKLKIHLFFRNGNLIFAQTNIKKFTLAYYFMEANKLTQNQYHSVEKLVKEEKISREEAIRKHQFLS